MSQNSAAGGDSGGICLVLGMGVAIVLNWCRSLNCSAEAGSQVYTALYGGK